MREWPLIGTAAKRLAVVRARFAARSTLGVRAMVRDERGRVLLLRHTYIPGWYFPGGGVEANESAAEAAAREILEETGIRLLALPRLVSLHLNTRVSGRDHVAFFHAETAETTPRARLGEIAEVGFFGLDALPEGVTGATLRRLGEAVEGGAPAREW
ncbi:MAG: NUDIX domain-containing protein [Phyllobacteriaceae bacterium]|nr:NUDIX domain-containing protein [Phyllobacteriaceae bacterium]